MEMLWTLFSNFFTHKSQLPPPEQWPGTMFTPLQLGYYAVMTALLIFLCIRGAKASEKTLKRTYTVIWCILIVMEPVLLIWEYFTGGYFDWITGLPLWTCSVFIYTIPFAIWGDGLVRKAACGYVCTVGLLGGIINFFYPANLLARYSCFSLPGVYTLFFHGAIVFTAVTMLCSGYHSFKGVSSWKELLLPSVPALVMSIPANIMNIIFSEADYMFFKLRSFFLAPIGQMLPVPVAMIIVYVLYIIVHAVPYIPAFMKNRKKVPV